MTKKEIKAKDSLYTTKANFIETRTYVKNIDKITPKNLTLIQLKEELISRRCTCVWETLREMWRTLFLKQNRSHMW
ncbi:hypothetical protein Bca52824_019048 [Brassica carinata]|uniref:Uncharacterized protein n=1 Tax=Brassica carinata TaxID=52824 RepID=A0A8X7VR98_BRACI|nr:hypothetical protein Bca52824_019048 [Brassica carinata]